MFILAISISAAQLTGYDTLFVGAHHSYRSAAELMTPGTTLVIRNGRVDMFKGVMRLSVDKWGKLERAPDDPSYTGFQPNTTHNLSATVYELVPMEE